VSGELTRVRELSARLAETQQLADRLLRERRSAIRDALDAGHTQADVARALGVTPGRVSQILHQPVSK